VGEEGGELVDEFVELLIGYFGEVGIEAEELPAHVGIDGGVGVILCSEDGFEDV